MEGGLHVDFRGPDAVFLDTTTSFVSMLGQFEKYKAAPAHVGHEELSNQLAQYRGYFEGGKHGDRINIALRKGARQTLTSTCRKSLHFLQAIATEEDMPILLQGGVTRRQRPQRKRSSKSQTATE